MSGLERSRWFEKTLSSLLPTESSLYRQPVPGIPHSEDSWPLTSQPTAANPVIQVKLVVSSCWALPVPTSYVDGVL